ncbi:rho guanine nucleotide exchange factor 15 isoform X2 [Lampris incognitus]|uniref:rho guanine nucleotide exchange factor 15 isoform X2 n=1 Tax=Lampris incognitus TaxID=2546036 RepID=UPI0024B536C2|nr:rho guanine nucleotide exchange factor 15 isoform X2 [Lampris incognitus]
MSLPEATTRPTSPPPPKPEARSKPCIPVKPSLQSDSTSLGDRGDKARTSGGKVKKIVNRFSQQETAQTAEEEKPANGTSEPAPVKSIKRAPTVKPKPAHVSLPIQKGGGQAPPLPLKKGYILRRHSNRAARETPAEEEGNGIVVEGGRSAPDGKEVDLHLTGGGERVAEHDPDTPVTSCCDPSCSCVCHLQRPGMKLKWVPISEDEEDEEEGSENELEGEEEEEEEERRGEGESEALDKEEGGSSLVGVESEECIEKRNKSNFHNVLDVLLTEGHRRRSDPGPPTVLTTVSAKRSQSPPIPPKRNQSPTAHPIPKQTEEEEDIYEATLLVVEPMPKNKITSASTSCQELDIPLIKVKKPIRRAKLSSSASDPTSEFQAEAESAVSADDVVDNVPPAIPPRMPVAQDKNGRNLTPVHRGGIPLPQPTPEEWRNLRPLSPNSVTISPPTRQRAAPQPPSSPLPKHRTPPPPPKVDPRRLSSVSLQSLTQAKESEENSAAECDKGDSEEEPRPVAPPRSGSTFNWESRLRDEPLYQTYHATVITKEIRRQTVCRNISKTSADYTVDWRGRRAGTGTGNGGPKGSSVAPAGQSTLWQDLPAVRESGVLEQLTPEQCKYQESMFEVLTSEAFYLRSLRVLTEHFLDNRDLEETLIIRDRKTLFSNILRVREVSERFLKDLEDRMEESLVFSDICDIIHYHAQHNFPAYIDYVRNQIYQDQTYTSLMKNNSEFATVITRLQESPQCQRLPFMSFLLLPFQRITRIKMLIENILKRTKERTNEEQTASKALVSVSKAIPIISQTRYLEKKGELQEMSKGGTLFNIRAKFVPIYLFLFNDLLIIASKKGAERFVVLDYAHRSLVQVHPADEGGSRLCLQHCFSLTLLENHQGRMMERLLKAPSQSDMDRWMAAFPNPSKIEGDEEEVIYEDWDCPQVQCVEQYIAQQTDELTLEPTEIINVVRKTSEGWYEGIRLSDGQKGWFPVVNVLEITNEHVRRRNLRERYRVMQAAATAANISKAQSMP